MACCYHHSVATDATRRRLIDAATRGFAEQGVFTASLIEITRRAGQHNRAAVHYHFGSRVGLLCAVLAEHTEFLAAREGELLHAAELAADDDVEAVVEAIVRPAAELAESGWRGRCVLLIIAELAEEDPFSLDAEIAAMLAKTGGHAVYALLEERMAEVPPVVRVERLSLATEFILRAVADRARALGRRRRSGRAQLGHEEFVMNLVAMIAGALSAPMPD
jgi:AcrR family transcriptional regulator